MCGHLLFLRSHIHYIQWLRLVIFKTTTVTYNPYIYHLRNASATQLLDDTNACLGTVGLGSIFNQLLSFEKSVGVDSRQKKSRIHIMILTASGHSDHYDQRRRPPPPPPQHHHHHHHHHHSYSFGIGYSSHHFRSVSTAFFQLIGNLSDPTPRSADSIPRGFQVSQFEWEIHPKKNNRLCFVRAFKNRNQQIILGIMYIYISILIYIYINFNFPHRKGNVTQVSPHEQQTTKVNGQDAFIATTKSACHRIRRGPSHPKLDPTWGT